MSDMNIRNIRDTLLVSLKERALRKRQTLREYVIEVLEKEVGSGDDERGAKGSGEKDYGETPDDGGGESNLREVDEEAGGLSRADERGVKGLRDVRGGIRGRGGRKGERGDAGTGAVFGSSIEPQPKSGTMGDGVRADPGGQGAGEGKRLSFVDRPFVGPAHRKGCGCRVCQAKGA